MDAHSTGICSIVILFLAKILCALDCRTCSIGDRNCLFTQQAAVIQTCPNVNDLCYAWFDRTGGVVGVERGCVSPDIEKFRVIQDLIGYLDHGCIKRQNGLACFRFCSIDECN